MANSEVATHVRSIPIPRMRIATPRKIPSSITEMNGTPRMCSTFYPLLANFGGRLSTLLYSMILSEILFHSVSADFQQGTHTNNQRYELPQRPYIVFPMILA